MKAYLMTGMGDIYSNGLFTLAERLRSHDIPSIVSTWYEWQLIVQNILTTNPDKIILVGHSKGANNTGLIAEVLKAKGKTVDLLVAIDPVRGDKIPSNVRHALCFRQKRLPFIGTPLVMTDDNTSTLVEDYVFDDLNHFTIDKDIDVHKIIMSKLEKL